MPLYISYKREREGVWTHRGKHREKGIIEVEVETGMMQPRGKELSTANQKLEEAKSSPLEPLGGTWPGRQFDFNFRPPEICRRFLLYEANQFVGICFIGPRKGIQYTSIPGTPKEERIDVFPGHFGIL